MSLINRNAYSFEVYPVALLGNDFVDVTVLATMDEDTAKQWIDTRAMHIQVFPHLPAGSIPDDSASYDYVKLRMKNNDIRVIGVPWIIQNTIELVNKATVVLEIADVNASDHAKIRAILAANGYKTTSVRTKGAIVPIA